MVTRKLYRALLISLTAAALLSNPAQGAGEEIGRVVLEGIEFGQGSAVLKKSSLITLRPLLDELKTDPHLSLTVEVHYDSRAADDQDLKLSRSRARVIYNWLTANGIDAARIRYVGLGATQTLADERAAKGRPEHARVEIVKARDVFPALEVPESRFNFETVVDGTEVYHDFVLRNTGTSPVHINDVRTG
jgi:hypothetical protein